MKIETITDALDSVMKLCKNGYTLSDALSEDYDGGLDDWTALSRYTEKLWALTDLMTIEATYVLHYKHIKFDNEEDKFEFQKDVNYVYKGFLIRNINRLIDTCRTWKFDDYRCVNFQKETKETMDVLLEFYSGRLDILNNYISMRL